MDNGAVQLNSKIKLLQRIIRELQLSGWQASTALSLTYHWFVSMPKELLKYYLGVSHECKE
jgi:hypothetical protein